MGECGFEMGIKETGRIVLITGGSRGIGLACAKEFLSQGDKVAITYNSAPPELDLQGPFKKIKCNVNSTEQIQAAFSEIENDWGPVEIVVSNAGINKDSLLLKMSEDSWQQVIDTNLTGSFKVAKKAIGPMIRSRFGRIIFVSSIVGLTGQAGQANYAASKAGLIGFARSLAKELASRNITVNVVAPGPVETDMLKALTAQQQQALTDMVPMKRVAKPNEIAACIKFLASDEASYVSGAVLSVDGGMGLGS